MVENNSRCIRARLVSDLVNVLFQIRNLLVLLLLLLLQSIGNVFANAFQFLTIVHLKGDGFVAVEENDFEQGFGIRHGTDLMFGHCLPLNVDAIVGIMVLVVVRLAAVGSKDDGRIGTGQ